MLLFSFEIVRITNFIMSYGRIMFCCFHSSGRFKMSLSMVLRIGLTRWVWLLIWDHWWRSLWYFLEWSYSTVIAICRDLWPIDRGVKSVATTFVRIKTIKYYNDTFSSVPTNYLEIVFVVRINDVRYAGTRLYNNNNNCNNGWSRRRFAWIMFWLENVLLKIGIPKYKRRKNKHQVFDILLRWLSYVWLSV